MEEWKEYKLEQVCENIYSGGTPATMVKEYWNGNLPWLSSGETGQRYIYSTEKTITQLGVDNSSTRYAYKNSIVVASAGQGYTRGQASFLTIDTYVNQSVIVLKPNLKLIDPKYLYFNIDNRYAELRQLSDGTSTRGSLSGKIMKDLSIPLPPLPTQQKIAAILSSLDDKIELNNKINTNLEQQAQALFKNWFVDFEPFGGKMPEGWKVGKLSDLITVKYGKDHKKLEDGNYPVYGSGGIMRKVDKYLYDKESVLIPRKGTLNNVFYINEPFWSVDTMFYTEMKKENIAKYVYFFVKGKDLNAMNAGSAVPSMTTEILNAIEVVIPSDEYLERFETIVSPMFKQIKQCIIENEKLVSLRDTLLPKLMNGEIEVEGIVL